MARRGGSHAAGRDRVLAAEHQDPFPRVEMRAEPRLDTLQHGRGPAADVERAIGPDAELVRFGIELLVVELEVRRGAQDRFGAAGRARCPAHRFFVGYGKDRDRRGVEVPLGFWIAKERRYGITHRSRSTAKRIR